MAYNRFIEKKADRICTGRKDKKINLIDRSITPNNFSFTMDLTSSKSAWAWLETRSGVKHWGGTNEERDAVTHVFGIAYQYDPQKKQLVEFNGKYFEIDSVQNMNGNNIDVLICCVELGQTANQTSWRM